MILQTPSPDHLQFEQICAEIDDFETLPAMSGGLLEYEDDREEDTGLDDQILAALVTPAY